MKAIVFGSNGQLGTKLSEVLDDKGYIVTKHKRSDCDFVLESIGSYLNLIDLKSYNLIINCSGLIDSPNVGFKEVFRVNLQVNYEIFNYFANLSKDVRTLIVVCGTTAVNQPRRNYPLYASSKTALANLVKSYHEILEDTEVKIEYLELKKFGNQMGLSEKLPDYHFDRAIDMITKKMEASRS